MTISTYGSDEGTWTVAQNRMWLPGIYDAKATALRAVEFPDQQLAELGRIYRVDGENRPVTMADLDALGADAR